MGGPGTEAFVQHNRRVYEDFKRAIRSTAPRFIPLLSSEEAPPNFSAQETTAGLEDEDGLEDVLQVSLGADSMYLKDMRLYIQRYVNCPVILAKPRSNSSFYTPIIAGL